MRIVINAGGWYKDSAENWAIKKILQALITSAQEHRFLLVFHHEPNSDWRFPPNAQYQIIPAPGKYWLARQYWMRIVFLKAIQDFQPHLIVNTGEEVAIGISVPQVWISPTQERLGLSKKEGKGKAFLNRILLNQYLKQNNTLVCFSNWYCQFLIEKFKPSEEQILFLPLAPNPAMKPLLFEEKTQLKDAFAAGNEYFFYPAFLSMNNHFIQVLKAFSLFKKWQKSNMKLIVAGNSENDATLLYRYKYREDVILLPNLSEESYVNLLSAAYALVYPVHSTHAAQSILDAHAAGVPVISSHDGACKEMGASAALYASFDHPDALAELMISVYKNENQKMALVAAGLKQAKISNFDASLESCLKIFMKASHS